MDDNEETEKDLSSSSCGHLRSYFVGMGFSPTLVDKVIEENVKDDANLLLEALFTYSVCIWIYLWINDNDVVESIGKIFIAVISFIAALGLLLYGGRLFFMLRRFPIESKGRRKKLHEVGTAL